MQERGEVIEKLEGVVEKLDEANDQLIIVNEKLDDVELARRIHL